MISNINQKILTKVITVPLWLLDTQEYLTHCFEPNFIFFVKVLFFICKSFLRYFHNLQLLVIESKGSEIVSNWRVSLSLISQNLLNFSKAMGTIEGSIWPLAPFLTESLERKNGENSFFGAIIIQDPPSFKYITTSKETR